MDNITQIEKIRYIYLTTNMINGKKYIGQHSTFNMDDGYMGSGKILLRAFNKYEKKNFDKEILHYCESQSELNFLEEQYIIWYETLSPKGYNLTTGGKENFEYCEKTKKLLIDSHKGYQYTELQRINHKRAMNKPEVKKKLSNKSKENWADPEKREKFTKALNSEEVKERRKKSFAGFKHSDECKIRMSEFHRNRIRPKNRKHIYNPETLERRMINIDEEIPEGFLFGWGKKASKIRIYNPETLERRTINIDEEIPEGFIKGLGKTKKRKKPDEQ